MPQPEGRQGGQLGSCRATCVRDTGLVRCRQGVSLGFQGRGSASSFNSSPAPWVCALHSQTLAWGTWGSDKYKSSPITKEVLTGVKAGMSGGNRGQMATCTKARPSRAHPPAFSGSASPVYSAAYFQTSAAWGLATPGHLASPQPEDKAATRSGHISYDSE